MKTKNKTGFTLIEVLMAAMLLGLVIAALAAASGAFTMANGYGIDLSTAEFLIEQIRERTSNTDFDTLLATYSNAAFTPPIDVDGNVLSDFAGFTQTVTIDRVQPGNLNQIDATGTSDFIRVTVTVTKNSLPLNSVSWIRANLN